MFSQLTRRQLAVALSSTIAAPLLPAFVAEAAPLSYTLKPQEIADGVWVIEGAQEAITFENGGAIANIVIMDSTDGAIVIDTGPSRRFGEALAALAQSLTSKPITRVYITHFHPDHAFGNQGFDAKIIAAPEGVITGLKEMGNTFSDAMYYIARDWMRGTEIVLPTISIAKSGVEDIGGRRLRLLPLSGHTTSDLAIFDETSGTLVTGDLAFLDRAPTTPHADFGIWRQSLSKLNDVSARTTVPGHGPVEASQRAVSQTKNWLDDVERIISENFEQGLDITEAMNTPLPENLTRLTLARYEFSRTVMHLYPKLEASRLPRVGGRAVD
ncbi:MAG: MBL fold metallo-hydrolase [Hyphomicrobium sp.]|nr:MAG: MBL fold metallo-hydrolase [Hyphomicrobium sp.]PPD00788.1 MAG: MBL fold metallo-hydrolase [Hyphomicrobium sp.]